MTATDGTQADRAIADLQSRIAFQEDTLQTLNQVIAVQDAAIARLQQQMQVLNKKLEDVAANVEQQGGAAGEEPPPPHY